MTEDGAACRERNRRSVRCTDMAAVFLLYVLVEIAAVWAVASAIGLLWTIVALLVGAVLGAWLVRREGGKALRALLHAAGRGGPARRGITEGMLLTLGGLLILLPGFVSDVAGILLLLPPVRALLARRWVRALERRMPGLHRPDRDAGMGAAGMVVDGEIVDDPREQPRRPATHPVIDPRA